MALTLCVFSPADYADEGAEKFADEDAENFPFV